jgi:hypothetical protein
MEYTIQWYWEGEKGQAIAPFLLPLTLKMPLQTIRGKAQEVSDLQKFPAHSFTITSGDGKLSERWFAVSDFQTDVGIIRQL